MWTANRAPSRPQRTPSAHSIGSVHSASRPTSRPTSTTFMVSPMQRRTGGYESDQSSDTATEDELIVHNTNFPPVPLNNMPAMWQSGRQQSGSAVSRLSQKFGTNTQDSMENSPDDDVHSRTSTLGGEEQDFDYPEKTPTMNKLHGPAVLPHLAGPLESQLASLMSKLIFMERENPVISVTPEDYKELTTELEALRDEKKAWTKRHEAIWALRDEDVENNIKIRGMLAKARRELEGMTKLRDEDLVNVQVVRAKLAEATRELERLKAQGGRASPSRGRPGSMMMDRRGTMDLFAAAKAAALEQRALELEKRNSDLLSQLEALKGGGANIDDLNRLTAHKAWKDTVSDLEAKMRAKDAEIARLRAGGATAGPASGSGSAMDYHRMEALHEEHASYREKVGGKMQGLRSEKEALQRELHRKEDENHALEVKVQSLQRRVSIM